MAAPITPLRSPNGKIPSARCRIWRLARGLWRIEYLGAREVRHFGRVSKHELSGRPGVRTARKSEGLDEGAVDCARASRRGCRTSLLRRLRRLCLLTGFRPDGGADRGLSHAGR